MDGRHLIGFIRGTRLVSCLQRTVFRCSIIRVNRSGVGYGIELSWAQLRKVQYLEPSASRMEIYLHFNFLSSGIQDTNALFLVGDAAGQIQKLVRIMDSAVAAIFAAHRNGVVHFPFSLIVVAGFFNVQACVPGVWDNGNRAASPAKNDAVAFFYVG